MADEVNDKRSSIKPLTVVLIGGAAGAALLALAASGEKTAKNTESLSSTLNLSQVISGLTDVATKVELVGDKIDLTTGEVSDVGTTLDSVANGMLELVRATGRKTFQDPVSGLLNGAGVGEVSTSVKPFVGENGQLSFVVQVWLTNAALERQNWGAATSDKRVYIKGYGDEEIRVDSAELSMSAVCTTTHAQTKVFVVAVDEVPAVFNDLTFVFEVTGAGPADGYVYLSVMDKEVI